jgi:hypothetical protein
VDILVLIGTKNRRTAPTSAALCVRREKENWTPKNGEGKEGGRRLKK